MIETAISTLFIIVGVVSLYVIAASLVGAWIRAGQLDEPGQILPMDTDDDELRRIARQREQGGKDK